MAPERWNWRDVIQSAPVEWGRLQLGEVFQERKERDREDLPLLSVTGDRGIIPRDELERRDTSSSDKSRYLRVAPGDLVYNTMRMWQGVSGISSYEGIVSPAYTVCEPRDSHSPQFLGYLCKLPALVGRFHAYSQGIVSDTLNLRFQQFEKIVAPIPPAEEQQRIAAVLSSLDDAIMATKRVIEQAKRVKQGLLRTLMTRGIRHTRFKKTEIGELPEVWDVVRLEDIAARGSGHTPSKQFPEYWDGDVNWVSLTDSPALDRVYLSETEKTITQEGIANSSAVVHPAGTVFVSRDAAIGKSAIAACELAVSQHFIAWQCGSSLNNHFLYYFLQYHKPQFERIAVGSTIKTIGLRYFKRLRLPLPPMPEQNAIADVLLSCDRSIWAQESAMCAFETLKRGLMQDLLTGRIRVHTA